MKIIHSVFALLLTFNVFAGTGGGAIVIVLEQNEAGKLRIENLMFIPKVLEQA